MKIGVFDSGIGGISILNELIKYYPMFNYVYIADYKNNPYGTKTYDEIELITKENINKLINMNVDLIVIACNTASVASYNIKTNIKVIRITDLIIKEVQKETNINNVYLYATNLTVNNKYYYNKLINNNIKIKQIKSSSLVPLIEEDYKNDNIKNEIKKLSNNYNITNKDTLILACTHFSHIKNYFNDNFNNPKIIDGTNELITYFNKYKTNNKNKGTIELYTTGDQNSLKESINKLKIPFNKIEIII